MLPGISGLDLCLRLRSTGIQVPIIMLTAKEFDLLEFLLRNPRQAISRDRILETVWGYDFMGESNIIEVYIRALRIKMEASNSKRLLHTVRGVGYVVREYA